MTERPHLFVLDDDGKPLAVTDPIAWGEWFERSSRDRSRIVQQDWAEESSGVGVSTVFLGLDHNFSGEGPPVLWETLVFGTSLDGEMCRYTSRAAALVGHDLMLREVQAAWARERA